MLSAIRCVYTCPILRNKPSCSIVTRSERLIKNIDYTKYSFFSALRILKRVSERGIGCSKVCMQVKSAAVEKTLLDPSNG